ncbi:MAG: phosphoribosyltransferase family protein [Muribaculaceae bacterium]
MKVITLSQPDFNRAVAQLADMVIADFLPELVVGVLNGGGVVGKAMMSRFGEKQLHCNYAELSLHRASTAVKQRSAVAWALRVLPTVVLDWLRIAESEWRQLRVPKSLPEGNIDMPDHLAAAASKCRRILIVDDAIDTGITAARITAALKTINPDADIRIAVITSTMKHPLITANYCLFPRRVLVRFPWSSDLKPSQK